MGLAKVRIDYIDVAKGLCMILVVWQHTHTYYLNLQTGEFYFESFRMPLFFMISGMFFRMYSGWNEFAKRKFNTLVVPFLFYYLLFSVLIPNLLAMVGYEGLRQESKLGWTSLFNCIFEKTYSNSPVWFLLALIWMNLVFYGIQKLAKLLSANYRGYFFLSLIVLCGFCGFLLGVNRVFVWANLDNAMTCLPFFAFGFYLKNVTPYIIAPPRIPLLIILVLVGLLVVMLLSHGLSFKQNKWSADNLLQIYVCGIMGSLSILALSKMIEQSTILKYYGKNTLTILCLQMPVIQVCNIVVKRIHLVGWNGFLMTFVLVLVAFFAIIPIINKYLPWVSGKKNLI